MRIPKQFVSVLLIFVLIVVSFPIVGTQSAGSGAELVGVKYDQGLDTDDDGAFDYLVVGVEISVSDAGYYQVQVSGLRDSNWNYISVSGSSNSSYLSSGSQVLNVSLNGQSIYESGYNPFRVDYMTLYGGQNPWDKNYYGSLYGVLLPQEYLYTQFEPPPATLTGTITDRGVDTDGDGLYNYLEIDVQVNVTKVGDFTVSISGLRDSSWNYISIWNSTTGYLDVGIGFLYVSLSGYAIRGSHVNASYVNYISLSALSDSYSSYLYDKALSRVYNYTLFDAPAFLTGVVHEKGIDTDADGKYNFLEIGVQINVSEPGNYELSINGLLDPALNYTYIDAYASTSLYLEAGVQFVNLTLDGTRIYLSQRNPRYVSQIYLWFWKYGYYRDDIRQVPLSKQYYYTEFDPPGAMLTGKISDKGVDSDSDGKFDWLEVGVEINVSDAGAYYVNVWGLVSASDRDRWPYYIYVWDYKTVNLNVGIQTVNLYLYGPEIYVSRQNPANVSSISVSNNQGQYHNINNVPLSRVYSYTEFDAPFWDAETKFVVYPDGRVVLEGSLKHTNMIPKNTGPTAKGFFNLTANDGGAQAQAGLTVTFPDQIASQFPFNSTTANLLATYQNGILNLGINSTMTLPPGDNRYQPYGQWPFNTTDGTIDMTYSGGILNLDINGDTTLPPIAKSQLPFNATDLTITGTYADNALNGRITFSILGEIPFDDVNVDFTGTRTDLTLNGTLTVVFGVPLGSLVIRDEADLKKIIDELESTIPGENGLVWNVTGGNLNVTTLDIDYVLQYNNGAPWGAKVTLKVEVQGDFVKGLAYVLSNGRNTELVYPVLEEAYKSAKTGSFVIDYKHDTRKAAVKLTFAFNLKRFVDNALTPPPGTSTYVLASYSMYPTLAPADVIFVEPVKNFSDIVADPSNGDIIAFQRPDYDPYYPQIIIHRAINKTQTFGNGTWYFQTKGDNNYAPDPWSLPEHLIIGKVVRRIPFLGYLLFPNLFGYPYYYSNTAVPLQLGAAAFSSIQEASIKLSYSSINRQFDIKLKLVDKLKELMDNITRTLPESWPPQIPPEVKEFYEKLLNTTYATLSSAQISASYANGIADLQATVNIEGDLNKEINYVKDLYFQLYRASFSRYNMTIPWQLDFIDKTQLDLSRLKVNAQLGETSFEGRIQGVTIMPPRDIINATHFKLERLFNLTAPQYSWQREFPGENQRLRITIEGGSNATHMVTLYRPPSVPEPNIVAPYQKSMTWFNQSLSSLKDLIFKIGPPIRGTLTVKTTPVAGGVYVNGEYWGVAPQSRLVDVGIYDVAFDPIAGYYPPASQKATVYENVETTVTGTYSPIMGRLTITTTPVSGEVFVNDDFWGMSPQSRVVQIGTYTVSFGAREGYTTPANQIATVYENTETTIQGVYQPVPGIVVSEITRPDLVSATNPFIVNATQDASTYLSISQISHPVTIIIKNVTQPEGVQPPPGTWKVLGTYVQITVNNTDVTVNATIRIYYTLDQLTAAGLDESTLKIHYWNATSQEWIQVESRVNSDEHYVWAVINHFSLWAVMGQPATAFPLQWIIGVIAIVVLVTILAVVIIRRRKPQTLTTVKNS